MAMRVVILREGTAMEAFKQVISFLFIFIIYSGIYTEKCGIYNEKCERNWREVELVT